MKDCAEQPLSWVEPRTEVRDTNRCGKGLFACKTISAGELVVMLGGG